MSEKRKTPPGLVITRLAVKEGETLRVLPDEGSHFDPVRGDWQPGKFELEKKMQPGDEFWSWSTPEFTWRDMAGRAGFAIVRNGEPIDYVWTVMN